jgi:arylsulfatase A-like enzyme
MEGVIYVRGEARKIGLDPAVPSLADALKRQGYATGIMGKWHLGYEPQFNPVHFGFDEFWGYRSGNIDYHSHYDNAGIYDWYHKLDTVLETGYSTDLITEHARTFIQENQEQPFFLYLAHESPHVPFQARGDTAYRWPGEDFSYYGPVEDRARAYREMVEQLDEGVGDIMTQLAELGLAENTLVVFTSDNGGLRDYAHQGALRGHKTELWEGGHRVPAIAHWPGTISAGQTDQLALTFDWFPTFVQLAGGNAATLPTLDGTDLSDLLLGRQAQLAERTVFWRYRDQLAMREGQWKWLATADDTLLLDLAVDLGESQNLRLNQAARSAEMKRQAQAFSEEMDGVAQKTR